MHSYNILKFSKEKRNRKGAYFKCETCGKVFYVMPSRIKQMEKKGSRIRFCSMACYDKRGENNPFWGKKHKKISIKKMKNHPDRSRFPKGSDNPNFIRWAEGIVVYKSLQKIKRYIINKKGKCTKCGFSDRRILTIHHIDKNKYNNKKENLMVICPNCHSLEHVKDGNRRVGIINDGNRIEDISNWRIET